MKFRATATPTAIPTPPELPAPIASDAATTVAVIDPPIVALRLTAPSAVTLALLRNALVVVRITFVDSAPAPLMATPVPPKPRPTATDAATEVAVMVADCEAVSVTLPATSRLTFEIEASTVLSIRFWARETPIESAPAFDPPTAIATAAAPAVAVIVELSPALTETLAGAMLVPPPSIEARTSVAILFCVQTPDPARLKALLPAPAIATEAATTVAVMVCVALAVAMSAPPTVRVEPLV